ncbi:hypothetical protein [Phocoenobacter skyensis]|uniref:Uncharacterized protein n=1 Tax=Phocoenobacter skyensis TaxID=97481 RepID=A0AAJ6P0E0_9PAST|nr:hypothetical protein [Pasteurella skyensis]MDP8080216.1 hypothetical protein [Pasteurella skyensis]MDP8086245.1 hypothetical protein [Pasteurella skyensis]MDP8162836.1 hypothetical protein [Pasteurella skyensis]MDP8172577.1 hypothetical protein [Pasteurella skyensis]MDP8179077.1 hypothetical protein [Pasteurella skyensis]
MLRDDPTLQLQQAVIQLNRAILQIEKKQFDTALVLVETVQAMLQKNKQNLIKQVRNL